jgi:hypothetical protein
MSRTSTPQHVPCYYYFVQPDWPGRAWASQGVRNRHAKPSHAKIPRPLRDAHTHPVSTTGRTARIFSTSSSFRASASGVWKISGHSTAAAWRNAQGHIRTARYGTTRTGSSYRTAEKNNGWSAATVNPGRQLASGGAVGGLCRGSRTSHSKVTRRDGRYAGWIGATPAGCCQSGRGILNSIGDPLALPGLSATWPLTPLWGLDQGPQPTSSCACSLRVLSSPPVPIGPRGRRTELRAPARLTLKADRLLSPQESQTTPSKSRAMSLVPAAAHRPLPFLI